MKIIELILKVIEIFFRYISSKDVDAKKSEEKAAEIKKDVKKAFKDRDVSKLNSIIDGLRREKNHDSAPH